MCFVFFRMRALFFLRLTKPTLFFKVKSASIYLVTKRLQVCLVYNTPRSDITGKEFHGPYVHDRYDHIVATIYQYTVFKKHAFCFM